MKNVAIRTPIHGKSREAGVTLLELIIAISLVALISAGMLTAMRTGLLTNEKITARLRSNREAMNLRQMLVRQIGGAMPAMAICPGLSGGEAPLFVGTLQRLRFVSSFSFAEGSRGYPQIVDYTVGPSQGGGFRLLVSEIPYTGPSSGVSFCAGQGSVPAPEGVLTTVAADHLAHVEFSYQQSAQQIPFGDVMWVGDWNQLGLPLAIKIGMAPLDTAPQLLPALDVTVRLRADRDFRGVIADR